MPSPEETRTGAARVNRRTALQLTAGAVVAVGGAWYLVGRPHEQERHADELRPDGKKRVPPSQIVITWLKPMGGDPGDPDPSRWRLRVHGEVKKPFELDYAGLLKLPQTEQLADVHCVTKWSCLDVPWTGVRIMDLAEKAGVKESARHVILEAANGYTSNVLLEEALAPDSLVAHHARGEPLADENGPPVRALIPQLYFWKSAKWLTGIRFAAEDEPGYWETRGYHNHADPWLEERYALLVL